ncbi:uncharacterized protein LOC131598292 [Vicia villosa]|uniref:uncharacterized protein LOC131598291 n=1 Tax=Vicia villosa TaxID=3911 RepID=UPI00273B764A|nr:uncharacterized protein LOC131598291 [Vicia villosa]XP_058726891.1 uncharacterized protein LOC131598292 [Vicia villosa]
MKLTYDNLCIGAVTSWYKLLMHNYARPKAKLIFWLACHNRLATKSRLVKMGMLKDSKCSFCNNVETIQHLFFECEEMRKIWCIILKWIQLEHAPHNWDEELCWIINIGKGKGWKAALLRLAVTETVYGAWAFRNSCCFGNQCESSAIAQGIIDKIVFRGWHSPILKPHIVRLMLI